MAGWIKMPLGREIGLGPSDFVLDGDPAPLSPKRVQSPPPNFWPMSAVAKRLDGSRWHLAWRWASVQATGLGSGYIVLDGTQLPPEKGGVAVPPYFRLVSIVVKRSPISATAELLYPAIHRFIYV